MTTIACVDGFNLALKHGSGIATYGRNLIKTLDVMGIRTQALYGPIGPIGTDPLMNEVLLAASETAGPKRTAFERNAATFFARLGVSAKAIGSKNEIIWPADGALSPEARDYWASRDLFRTASRSFHRYGKMTPLNFDQHDLVCQPDVCHWTTPIPINARGTINVYTIHDLIPLILPFATLDNKRDFLDLCRKIARCADHIIVGSQSARLDVMRILGVPEDRITNTYHSVAIPPGHLARSDAEVSTELESAFGLDWKSYLIHYGTIEPKKNLGRIIEAYLASGIQSPLVVVGARGWLDLPETSLMNQVKAGDGSAARRIHVYDYIPAATLASLVRGAKALIFPSLYEGFGLPVLEAMTLGTAVVTSSTGSLPEVVAEAGLTVDPYDVDALRKAMIAVDSDQDLRRDMERRGLKQARIFSPEAYRDRLSSIYRSLGLL